MRVMDTDGSGTVELAEFTTYFDILEKEISIAGDATNASKTKRKMQVGGVQRVVGVQRRRARCTVAEGGAEGAALPGRAAAGVPCGCANAHMYCHMWHYAYPNDRALQTSSSPCGSSCGRRVRALWGPLGICISPCARRRVKRPV